jgi:F-type H+-transporting ATPase subunit b
MINLADSTASTNPLLPSWPEFIIGTILFVLVFGFLAKIALPRILKTLEERHDAIEGGINRADEAQEEAKQVLAQYRAQLDDARHESARMREEAREQGAQIIAEMRTRAEAEARRITEAAQAQIEAERQQALASLRTEVGALATELASRIVGESHADAARQNRMVDRFLAELEQGAPAGDGQPAPAGPAGQSRAGAGQ